MLNERPLKSKKHANFFAPSQEEQEQIKIDRIKKKLSKKERTLKRIKAMEEKIEQEKTKLLTKQATQEDQEEEKYMREHDSNPPSSYHHNP